MTSLLVWALVALFLILAGLSLGLLITVIRVGPERWAEASELSGSTSDVLAGNVRTERDGIRDPRVAKGKVWERATGKWKPQGKLTDEYIRNIVS